MTRRKVRATKNGASRMTELGYKPMQIWLDPDTHRQLGELARYEDRPMTNLVLRLIKKAIRETPILTNAELAELAKAELENRPAPPIRPKPVR